MKVFLSERLCQDPLEFFGCQSQHGGTSENPNTVELCKNTQTLGLIGSVCGYIPRVNCRGNKRALQLGIKETTFLPKRRHAHANMPT